VNDLRAAILRGARAVPRPGSAARGTRPGDGLAFSQLRAYVEGDDPRRIDQAATARAGALQTRVYREDTALVLAAILDQSASMRVGRHRSLAQAGKEALRAWFGVAEHDDTTARIVDERVVRDRRAAPLIDAARANRLEAALTIALRALPRGASLLMVTDGFDLVTDDLLQRAGRRFDATVLLARDPWFEGLALRGTVRVRDSETGIVRGLIIGERERSRYHLATRRRAELLQVRYRASGWRTGTLDERDGRASLFRAFGLPG
jgi:uncharacterized protein (DUF58 family)